MLQRLRREPVAIGALLRIGTLLGARYGLNLGPDDILGALLVVEVVVSGLVRQQVSPTAPAPVEP